MQQPTYHGFNSSASISSAGSMPNPSSSTIALGNPGMNIGNPGPSAASGQKLRKTSSNAKAKRASATDTDGSSGGGTQRSTNHDGPRKKKAARACFHCQKAHLTCDDSRPCQRCVKRGIADKCTEGVRKKAKYLLEDEELEAMKNGSPTTVTPEISQLATAEPFPPGDPLFNLSFDPNFTFGSEAANLEYSILSAILGNPSHDHPHHPSTSTPTTPFAQQFATSSWPSEPRPPSLSMPSMMPEAQSSPSFGSPMSAQQQGQYIGQTMYEDGQGGMQQPPTPSDFTSTYSSPGLPYANQQAQMQNTPQNQLQQEQFPQVLQHQAVRQHRRRQSQVTSASHPHSPSSRDESLLISPPLSNASPLSSNSITDSVNASTTWNNQSENQSRTGQNIYETVTKAYDYTEGYHFLMKFLPKRFERNDLLRVVRALAIFRPSLIALQTPLSVEDEVFVEKCFQRSLKELDKLISFSGTPTVVWRRTGEICLVGVEFCQLTEWDKSELIDRRKYIYELFENQSVVEYWEKFALHAFENTTQSVYSHCVLLKPSGEPVPCTFCFSIRRDIFDLPSIVIGQWLPLL
ncbi:hypothetical protein BD410DRAFT_895375 [Rickenella mellea]|uniref:Transcription activator of gluconeogenesis ERT1 n=1 Tax=Rickenella mellea TaxID=50990 RepID=A0A4Y7QGB2_9AGAM|nr:hypothetical protein BD410DRAFT_895375 [Rickenella mellea]